MFLEQAQSNQAVLHLVECDQDLRAILRHGLLVSRLGALNPGAIAAAFKQRKADVGADAPDAVFPIENILQLRAFHPGGASELDGRKESRLGNANAFTGGRHGTFRLRNIRPPFQQVGWQADGNFRRLV